MLSFEQPTGGDSAVVKCSAHYTTCGCIEVGVTARPAFEDVDVLVISKYF